MPDNELNSKSSDDQTICFAIAANPNESFISQIAFFRLCLDKLGGKYAESRIFLFVGDSSYTPIPDTWRWLADRLTIIPVNTEEYEKRGYFAQGGLRLAYHPFYTSDIVIFCDADTALIDNIDEAVELVSRSRTIAGVMAHYPPFDRTVIDNRIFWHELFDKYIGQVPDLSQRYSLLEDPSPGNVKAPYYVNFGCVIFHRDYLYKFAPLAFEYRYKLLEQSPWPYFCAQLALSLVVAQLDLGFHVLPMEYNFPNDANADRLHHGALEKLKLIHYLREDLFSRKNIFRTSDDFNAFLSLELTGSNQIFQSHVRTVTGGKWDSLLQ